MRPRPMRAAARRAAVPARGRSRPCRAPAGDSGHSWLQRATRRNVTRSRCRNSRVITANRPAVEEVDVEVIANAGIMALACMFVGVLPMALAIVYVIWPTEQRLALLRPLSLATVFAAIAGTALGFINELRFVSRMT